MPGRSFPRLPTRTASLGEVGRKIIAFRAAGVGNDDEELQQCECPGAPRALRTLGHDREREEKPRTVRCTMQYAAGRVLRFVAKKPAGEARYPVAASSGTSHAKLDPVQSIVTVALLRGGQETHKQEFRKDYVMNIRIHTLVTLLLVPACLGAQDELIPPEPAEGLSQTSPEIAERQVQRDRVDQQIGAIEAKATRSNNVREKLDAYRDLVMEEMIREAPEKEAEIRHHGELTLELMDDTAITTGPDDPVRREKLTELRKLEQDLGAIHSRVEKLKPVEEARRAYYNTLAVEMADIDSRTRSLLDKYRQLTKEIAEIRKDS